MAAQKTAAKQFMGIGKKNNVGHTALHLAAKEGNEAILRLLLDFAWNYDPEKILEEPDSNIRPALNFGERKRGLEARVREFYVTKSSGLPYPEWLQDKIMEMWTEDFFSHEVWLNIPDNQGQAALQLAKRENENEAVESLLVQFGHRIGLKPHFIKGYWNRISTDEER